jgi:hypothetical protein
MERGSSPPPTEVMVRNALSGVPLKEILEEHTNYGTGTVVSEAASDVANSIPY